MPGWLSWIVLTLALVLGVLGGVLAAKVNTAFFWPGFGLGLACLALYIWKADAPRPETAAPIAPVATPEETPADAPVSDEDNDPS